MSTSKAEIAVLVFLLTIAAAAGLVYEGHRLLGSQLVVDAEQGVEILRQGERLLAATIGLLGTALLLGCFYIFPVVRQQSREQGKLHRLAGILRQRSRVFEQAALTDPLTGMHNRRYFDEALRQYLSEFQRIGRPVGLMVLDLDHFKTVNDTHGHGTGDEMLKAIAGCLFEFTRHHDIVARMGGEEFAIVAPNMGRADLAAFAERIRTAVERLRIDAGGRRLGITVSLGLAVAEAGEDPDAFYRRADANLYRAKQAGRNRIAA